MKRLPLHILNSLFILFLIIGCDNREGLIFDKTPEAKFSASLTSIDLGQSVQFTDESTNKPTSWSWDFGDGNKSTKQNPAHTYSAAGIYTVQLIATNDNGLDTLLITDYITVSTPGASPIANFTASLTTVCVGVNIQFTDKSTNTPTSWKWDFGDGKTSTLQNPTHNFSTAGTYSVKLTISNTFGSNSKTRTSYITVSSCVITTQTSNIVVTNITATSATISWTNGDGSNRVVFVENPSGTAAGPSDNTTYTASTDWSAKGTRIGTSNYYCVYNGSGNSVTLKNLTPNSRFAIRIQEYNGAAGSEKYFGVIIGIIGNPSEFTTLKATAPNIQTSNIVVTNITSTSATLSWTNGDGTNRVVFVENPSFLAASPSNNTTYIASTDWNTKGTRLGTSNYYCVYNGSGNSVTLTNLPPNSDFAVRIQEYNGEVGSEQYLLTTTIDNPYNFATNP